MNVAIVHYNTPALTSSAIRSLNKVTPGCHVTVFDNSNIRPFVNSFQNVDVIDNTQGKVIDFKEMLSKYPDRQMERNRSNFGSAKHCKSVDVLMDIIPDGFLLLDSDVLLLRDVGGLCNDRKAVVGEEQKKCGVPLFCPFICWINVPMLRSAGIRYFNGDKMWALSSEYPNNRYDTGAWLYEEVRRKGMPWERVNIWDYIIHFGHGSWKEKDTERWLNENERLWRY